MQDNYGTSFNICKILDRAMGNANNDNDSGCFTDKILHSDILFVYFGKAYV